ncbi:MAG: TA system VapC family ribonuclease toxin, partial [Kofleriaceae bacterium]
MILPDLNLVVYAHNRDAPHHAKARAWWEGLLNATEPVGIAWVVVLGFIRLTTHRSVLTTPMSPAVALGHVRAWFAQPNVERLEPGPHHLELF